MTTDNDRLKPILFSLPLAIALLSPCSVWAKTYTFSASSRPGYFSSAPKSSSSSAFKSYSGTRSSVVKSAGSSVGAKFGKPYNSSLLQPYSSQAKRKAVADAKTAASNTSQSPSAAKPKHFPVADLQKYRQRYADNSLYQQAAQEPDAWGTRSRYQQAQTQAPAMVNGGSDTFGMLSGQFLYKLLNNPNAAGEYAYHHQDNRDYQQWRAEAERLAGANAELRAQLVRLDAARRHYGTTPPNPGWLPQGVPAAAVVSEAALKSGQADFNVCVGSEGGPYYKVAQTNLLPELVEWVNVNPVITLGTPEILAKLAVGECDAGFIQGDAQADSQQMDVVFRPFLEAAHLACHVSAQTSTIADMTGQTVWIPRSSGARLTWDKFVALNPRYGQVAVKDAASYVDAINKAVQTKACLLYMAAPHAAAIDRLLNRKTLKLVAIDDPALLGSGGYQATSLSSGDYSQAIPDAYSIQTVAAPATFVVSKTWQSQHADIAAKVTQKLADVEQQITRNVQQ
ncbi:TAXI family TRAP transporter solute-binding subunit [Methylovulum psychrotolerans]|uniref:Uncharacterized protein n=1 Tax=Methylovulum psychrotolerans TaxID=1704499 RepID=A0A1Z4BV30_9GAMM|nr:hypothetical protein [Methylovulum psychrotolerans]ASF45128.1 hypothetical protein CEK71_03070 [Methylovulum psychrotolerans]